MSVDVETCHIVVMNDEEMDVLKLLASGLLAMNAGVALPPHPTEEQVATLVVLCQRIQEM